MVEISPQIRSRRKRKKKLNFKFCDFVGGGWAWRLGTGQVTFLDWLDIVTAHSTQYGISTAIQSLYRRVSHSSSTIYITKSRRSNGRSLDVFINVKNLLIPHRPHPLRLSHPPFLLRAFWRHGLLDFDGSHHPSSVQEQLAEPFEGHVDDMIVSVSIALACIGDMCCLRVHTYAVIDQELAEYLNDMLCL